MQNVQDSLANLSVTDKEKDIGRVPLAPKRPPGTLGQRTTVGTNIRKITLTKNQPIYKYDFNVCCYHEQEDRKPFVAEISKSRRSDVEHQLELERCQKVYQKVMSDNPTIFQGTFFYDRQASLYSLSKLPKNEYEFTYGPNVFHKDPNFVRTVVKIKQVDQNFQVSTNDARNTVNPAPANADKTLLEALNTIISGPACENANVITYGSSIHYLIDPSIANFSERDFLIFSECDKYSGVGLSKSIKALQGTNLKEPTFYLTTEVKHTIFHGDGTPLLTKIGRVPGFNRNLDFTSPAAKAILKEVKGLQCYVLDTKGNIPADPLIITIKGFGANALNQEFEYGGRPITVFEYYGTRYRYTIKNPNLFTVVSKHKKRNNYFPVEMLIVCDSQVVKTEQLARKEQDEAIKCSAVEPRKRKDQTERVAGAIGILDDTFGGVMSISQQSEVVPGRVLQMPSMLFQQNSKGAPRNGNTWMSGGKYFEAAKIDKWEVHVFGMDNRFNVNTYIARLREQAGRSGLQLAPPEIVQGNYNPERFAADFAAAKQRRGCQFLMVISKDALNIHPTLKALEQQYDLLTQDIRGSVAQKTLDRNQSMTLDNVIHKINMKNGGLNFQVVSQDGKANYTTNAGFAFIGFETTQRSSSASSDVPVMIGYASNCQNQPQKYAGGFEFVPKGSDVFGPAIKHVVEKTIRGIIQNRKVKPTRLVVFFNGVSEGQFALINERYVKLIKEACAVFNTEAAPFQPHICVLAVTKTHQERFYKSVIPNGKPSEQNIPPGLVVDQEVVSPVYNEFYLNAHNAFQGTAKTPKYTLIFDSSNTPMDVFQTVCHQLCYLHEIVYMPVALPAPLVIADRYAKRASTLFSEASKTQSFKVFNGQEDVFDYEKLNKELGYEGKNLDKVRYNA